MIEVVTFRTAAHQKKTQLFSIIISELNKLSTELKNDVHLSEVSEMTENEQKNLRIKMLKKFHDFLNIFVRKAAEVLPLN